MSKKPAKNKNPQTYVIFCGFLEQTPYTHKGLRAIL